MKEYGASERSIQIDKLKQAGRYFALAALITTGVAGTGYSIEKLVQSINLQSQVRYEAIDLTPKLYAPKNTILEISSSHTQASRFNGDIQSIMEGSCTMNDNPIETSHNGEQTITLSISTSNCDLLTN